jgi:hypothetical protein
MMSGKLSLASGRQAVIWFLFAVLGVAAAMLLFDGGRSAVAAGDCQYQPYQPYGEPCPKATPTLATTPQPAEAHLGWYVYDRATLSGGNAPTGTLSFALYRPDNPSCSVAAFTWEGRGNGNGDYYPSSFPVDAVGTWRWTVVYSGDDNNEPATSGCSEEPVTVATPTPSIFLSSYGSTGIGSTLYASGYGYGGFQPNGSATVRLYRPSDPTCSGTPVAAQGFPWSGGSLSIWMYYGPADEIGTWRYRVDYPGDANNGAVSLGCGTASAEVVKASPSIWTGLSSGNVVIGQDVSLNGQVSYGYQPTGTVAVQLFAADDPGCSSPAATKHVTMDPYGAFSTTFTPTGVGTWRVVVSYPGDDFNNPASSWCGMTVLDVVRASPTVFPVATPTTATTGRRLQAVTLVEGGYKPDGRVTFRLYAPDDPTCAGLPAYIEEAHVVGGAAATSTGSVASTEGTWRWQVAYAGDASNNGATSGCDEASVSVASKLETPPKNPGGTPFVTNVYSDCVDDHSIGVPYGSRLVLRVGFQTKTQQQIKSFLNGTATRAVVDGVPVGNAKQYWDKPVLLGGLWTATWEYDTERVVTAYTQPFTVEFSDTATKAGTDGFATWNAGDVLVTTGGPCVVASHQPS